MGAQGPRRLLTGLLVAVLVMTATTIEVAARDDTRGVDRAEVARSLLGTPKPFVNPVPNGTVGVLSDQGYIGEGFVWIVGEVINRTSARRDLIEVTATFEDADENVLGTATEVVYLERLAPGMTSPFLVQMEEPPGVAFYRIASDSGVVVNTQPSGGLRVVQGATTSGGGLVQYHGTVFNPNPWPVDLADANVSLYDGGGDVIDVWWAYTTPSTIPANASGTYEVEFFVPEGGLGVIQRVGVVSQAWRDGSLYVTSWENYFDDIANDAFRNEIIWLAGSGITAGCGAGKYCPTAQVKRDQMASFLARALGLAGTPADAFSDDNGNIHEAQINRLFAAGVTSGCGPGLFCPGGAVARDQMASFLARALELGGTPPDAFSDDNGNIHEAQINRLFTAGVTSGCGGTKFCPSVNVTRGQMAAFLKRAFD